MEGEAPGLVNDTRTRESEEQVGGLVRGGLGVSEAGDGGGQGVERRGLIGNAVANFSYTWDTFGNLTQRVDAIDNITEAITPDALNQISTVAMTGATTGNLSVTYDAIGNITSKSDVGTYTNNPSGFGVALPHGIGHLNSGGNWTYDSNGNLTGDTTRTLTYTAANQPATMQEGSNTLTFSYDTEHQRFLQIEPGNVATVYFSAGGILAEAVTSSGGAITRWNDYIFVGSEMIAVYYEPIGQAAYTRYYHKDHLGSVAALTDDSGTVQQRMSYDAWGKQRNINGSADTTCSLPAADQTTRTYTGQETLAAVCLIHMNARAYDPQIGKFTSPDSEIDDPTDSQAYNRFAYVHNRPLVMTDPTGHLTLLGPIPVDFSAGGGFDIVDIGERLNFLADATLPNGVQIKAVAPSEKAAATAIFAEVQQRYPDLMTTVANSATGTGGAPQGAPSPPSAPADGTSGAGVVQAAADSSVGGAGQSNGYEIYNQPPAWCGSSCVLNSGNGVTQPYWSTVKEGFDSEIKITVMASRTPAYSWIDNNGGAIINGLYNFQVFAAMTVMGGPEGDGAGFAAEEAAPIVKEGIYEFSAASGKTYVGQSGNIASRIEQHVASGKLREADRATVNTTEVLGGRTAREIAEQQRINQLDGVQNLENIRNPIGPARQNLLQGGTMISGIKIEEGGYGRKAVITSSWSDEIAEIILKEKIVDLELNDGKGWRGVDISFLSELPNLRSLKIIDLKISCVEPIHFLHKLQTLEVLTYCQTEIKFFEFPKLEECSLEWRPKATSLFDCTTLRKLFVNRYSGKDVNPFGQLIKLEELAVLNSSIENIVGFKNLKHLKFLRLANLKRLTSLSGIEGLVNLEELEIHTCRSIGSIDEIGSLINLRKLYLNNDGDIASLKPIKDLNLLDSVLFYESTNIVDGDISPLLGRKNLSRVSFQNRRHYSHKREAFDASHAG